MNAWASYPFSAHIVQHILLGLVIPALLLLGTPAFHLGRLNPLERILGQPPVSWLLGVGTMLAWHFPALFNAALANNGLHIFQQLSFLISGIIFWWPISGPLPDRHLPPLAAVAYLFSACLCCTLMGAFLTFGPSGLYAVNLHPHGANHGAIDPKGDRQMAGLLMWVPGCFIYLSGILWTVRCWYAQERTA
jgi:cytochrome c oxidase assembly factor CtaG